MPFTNSMRSISCLLNIQGRQLFMAVYFCYVTERDLSTVRYCTRYQYTGADKGERAPVPPPWSSEGGAIKIILKVFFIKSGSDPNTKISKGGRIFLTRFERKFTKHRTFPPPLEKSCICACQYNTAMFIWSGGIIIYTDFLQW